MPEKSTFPFPGKWSIPFPIRIGRVRDKITVKNERKKDKNIQSL